MSITENISKAASHTVETARGVRGYVNHTASRVGDAVGAKGAFQSIADSGFGKFVGRHKFAAGVVAAGTVATVAYNMGGNRERLMQQRASHEQGLQR